MENKRKDGKTPCMVVTQKQYDNDLRCALLRMGFREEYISNFSYAPLLIE